MSPPIVASPRIWSLTAGDRVTYSTGGRADSSRGTLALTLPSRSVHCAPPASSPSQRTQDKVRPCPSRRAHDFGATETLFSGPAFLPLPRLALPPLPKRVPLLVSLSGIVHTLAASPDSSCPARPAVGPLQDQTSPPPNDPGACLFPFNFP